jgi:predicted RNA-binding Zn-ribbon protein involved in translation (DUF1610 family)
MLDVKSTLDAASATPLHRVRRARPFRRPVRMWFAALLFLASYAALITFMVLAARMFISGDRTQGVVALSTLGGFVALRLLAMWQATVLTCPLCHGGVLQEKRCRKHGNAKRLPFFGYRPLVVLSTVFTARFTCVYCGSPFRLKQ